jgi:hypothetical protein
MKKPTFDVDECIYQGLMKAYEMRVAVMPSRVIGFRDSLDTMMDWQRYCLEYKPVRYHEFRRMIVDAWNRDIPPLPFKLK